MVPIERYDRFRARATSRCGRCADDFTNRTQKSRDQAQDASTPPRLYCSEHLRRNRAAGVAIIHAGIEALASAEPRWPFPGYRAHATDLCPDPDHARQRPPAAGACDALQGRPVMWLGLAADGLLRL